MRAARPLNLLVAANAVSLTGNVMGSVAVPWFVLTTTGSAALTGVAAFAGTAPMVVGSLVAGRIVDRLGARATSIATDLVSGATIAGIPLLYALGALELWHLAGLVALGTLFDAAGAAARMSLLPPLAASAGMELDRANARFGGAEHVGYLLGAPLAGVLIALVGAPAVLWIDALSFAASASLLSFAGRTPRPRTAARDARPTLRAAVGAIRRDRVLVTLLVVPAAGALLIDPLAPVVLPILARDLGGSSVWLGIAVAAYGVGGLAGLVASPRLRARFGRRRLYVGAFVAWPALYALLALLPPIVLAVAVVLAVGALAGAIAPIETTVVQERSPAELLPRVIGLSTAVFRIAGPIAILVVGLLIERVGLRSTLAILTAGTVALAVYVVLEPAVRRFDPVDPH
jgi:MFS family permease